jgi:hypothetical protein
VLWSLPSTADGVLPGLPVEYLLCGCQDPKRIASAVFDDFIGFMLCVQPSSISYVSQFFQACRRLK